MRDNKEVSSVSLTDSGARHRTAATEKASVPGYPDKLFIFKTEATSYWQVRCQPTRTRMVSSIISVVLEINFG